MFRFADDVYATTKETAQFLGISQPTLVNGIRQGKFPFGVAIKNRGKGYTYLIFIGALKKFADDMGIMY